MSKVISFSISDRYLDQIRSLYPDLSDNLAAKQFLTDRLDASLDDGLDDRVKTLVESKLDGFLDERLDATVGKLIGSLAERLARLESRLDGSLDGNLDDGLDGMEPLLKREREASIASPSPSPDETDSSIAAGTDAIEPLPGDTFPPNEPANPPAIDSLAKGYSKGLTDSELARLLKIDKSNITRWKQKGEPTQKYRDKWELRGRLWYTKD